MYRLEAGLVYSKPIESGRDLRGTGYVLKWWIHIVLAPSLLEFSGISLYGCF